MSELGSTLAAWRRERGWSQDYAAELIGVTQAAWAAWETGRKSPELRNALELERLTDGQIKAAAWTKPARRRGGGRALSAERSKGRRRAARRHPASS